MGCYYKTRTTVLFTGLWLLKKLNNISVMMRHPLKLVEKIGGDVPPTNKPYHIKHTPHNGQDLSGIDCIGKCKS